MPRVSSVEELEQLRAQAKAQRAAEERYLAVCSGTGCRAYEAEALARALRSELDAQRFSGVELRSTGCHGFCEMGPIVTVYPQEVCYMQVKPEDAADIVSETVGKGEVIERLLYKDPVTRKRIAHERDIPFYKNQTRLLLKDNTQLDPNNILDYIALDGYTSLARALTELQPEEIIATVKAAGLRGRGGAGFPTGMKWEITRAQASTPKCLVVNADEGDPGAYMDRSLLEGNPHSVIEGVLIGAYAIGASHGYVYVREEYPLAVNNLSTALQQAREYGLLGEDILGCGLDFDITIHRGGGAFVCGEETALLASLEGRSGTPRQRPPYPAERGLWEQPTCINNVETWANVPHIIEHGAEWYQQLGTESSKGTKIFSLVGKVNNTGLVEVPMGMSLREIVFDIGGCIRNGKKLKAIQTGGPSGGTISSGRSTARWAVVPARLIETPVDFDELARLGSMMGSGGMIVMDEDTCMVDMARYFIEFLCEESCGQCLPCREGLQRMREILTRLTEGLGEPEDIALLEELAEVIRETSLCALGGTAPNPVLSTLTHFRDEYEAHAVDKWCPAFSCKALTVYEIDPELCVGCMLCKKNCATGAIKGELKQPHVIDIELCTRCGTCYDVCPPRVRAVKRRPATEVERNPDVLAEIGGGAS